LDQGAERIKKRKREIAMKQTSGMKVARKGMFIEPSVYKADFGDYKENGCDPPSCTFAFIEDAICIWI
jgi:hypothetical protein